MTETPGTPPGPAADQVGVDRTAADQPTAYLPPAAAGHQPPVDPAAVPPAFQPPPPGYQPAGTQPPAGLQPPAGYQPPPVGVAAQQPVSGDGFGTPTRSSGKGRRLDASSVHPLDWAIIAAGVLAFVFSLLPFYSYRLTIPSVRVFQARATLSAWHGFFGWFGALLALAAAGVLAAELIAGVRLPVQSRPAVLGAFVVSLISELLALLVVPGGDSGVSRLLGVHISTGHGYGYWLTLLAVLAGTVLSYLRFAATGGALPRLGSVGRRRT